ncbi:MAG: hypothetical protein GEU97_09700 [Actinophytocola sp.]|nr:hypothetical protein [Actinophytocola sp.]
MHARGPAPRSCPTFPTPCPTFPTPCPTFPTPCPTLVTPCPTLVTSCSSVSRVRRRAPRRDRSRSRRAGGCPRP